MSADEWAGLRVYMRDRQRFLRDAASVSAATSAMGAAAARYGVEAEMSGRKSFLMNQAMFTTRRMVYGATLAFTGAIAGAAALGVQFDIMRQNADFAFKTLLGSAGAARQEVEFLFQLAAKTPFEFQNVQQFARQFLGWGFSLKQTNRYLSDFSDVISAMGGDVSIMDRVSLAFGQIRSAGVLLGQDLRQLQQAIPGVSGMLQKQLHLTPQQMGRIGQLRIPANVAIEAIMRGIETDPRFRGAAAALQKSAQGQLSTLHDYASRLFGDIAAAPFAALVAALPNLNDDILKLTQTLEDRGFGAFVDQLDAMTGAGGNLSRIINVLAYYATQLFRVWNNDLKPAIQDTSRVAIPILYVGLLTIGHILQFAADHGTALRVVLDLLITRFIFIRTIRVAIWLTTVANAALIAYKAFRLLTIAQIIEVIVGARVVTGLKAMWFWMEYGSLIVLPRLISMVWGLTAALLANPIVLIIVAVIALIAILVVLYFKWKAFHDFVDATFHFIQNNWPIIVAVIGTMLGPIGMIAAGLVLVITHLQTIVRWAKDAARAVSGIKVPGTGITVGQGAGILGTVLPMIPLLQHGGIATSAGWSIVGEHGPELHYLPGPGASVLPLDSVAPVDMADHELVADVPVVLKLDSRVIAEANARVKLRKRARA